MGLLKAEKVIEGDPITFFCYLNLKFYKTHKAYKTYKTHSLISSLSSLGLSCSHAGFNNVHDIIAELLTLLISFSMLNERLAS